MTQRRLTHSGCRKENKGAWGDVMYEIDLKPTFKPRTIIQFSKSDSPRMANLVMPRPRACFVPWPMPRITLRRYPDCYISAEIHSAVFYFIIAEGDNIWNNLQRT